MILDQITELRMFPVQDRGVPNQERIAILAEETVNLGQYGVMLGHANQDGTAIPFIDNLFWFGDSIINKGDWVILYTGSGQATSVDWEPPGTQLYSIHWGKENTIFANTNIVPILIRLNGIAVGSSPLNQPQTQQISE